LWLPLTQIAALANVAPDWPLRFSCSFTITDVTQSAAAMMFSPLANIAHLPYFYVAKNPTTTANTFEIVVSSNNAFGTVTFGPYATEFTNDNAIIMEMIGGMSRASADLLLGVYAGGWPANSSLLAAGPNQITGSLFADTSNNPSRIASWGIGLGGWHLGAGATAPTVVFQHLRVEYLAR
jgi:hypothetical protein